MGDLENSISSIRISIDHRVAQKGNIDQRLIQAVKAMNELELKMKRIHVFIDESMDQYIETDKKAKSPPLKKEKFIWNQFLDGLTTAYDSTKGFVSGLSDSVLSTVDGLWQVIRHPIKTAKGLVYVVQHPVKTGEAIWQTIKESWNTDVVNGNAESSSHWFGRAFGEAALALVGTKGVDKAVKLTRGTELIKEVGGVKVTYGIKDDRKLVNISKEVDSSIFKEKGEGSKLVSVSSSTVISPEMEAKILEGQRKVPKNIIIGGHSPSINNANDNFAVEVLSTNVDGTKNVVFTKQFPDGNISKLKKSTLFPESWSDEQILKSIIEVGDTPAKSTRLRDGATWHRVKINGIEIDAIKNGDDVISGYPTGSVNAPRPSGF